MKRTHPLESFNVYEYLKINFTIFSQVDKVQDGKKGEFAQMASLDKKTTLTTVLQTAVTSVSEKFRTFFPTPHFLAFLNEVNLVTGNGHYVITYI